jgi:hypothetical protein
MTEFTELAQKTMEVLTPLLPSIATKASETLVAGAGKSLFTWLSNEVKSKPAAATLDRAVAEPENPHRLAALRGEIEELAEKDPAFRQQLAERLKSVAPGGAITTKQTLNQTGDGNKTVQNVGNENKISIR